MCERSIAQAQGGFVFIQDLGPSRMDRVMSKVLNRQVIIGEQLVNALYPAAPGPDSHTVPEPGPRLYYPPTRSDFKPLKNKIENEWLAELYHVLALDATRLPVIWDADFLYGEKNSAGEDTYVLCEINVCSVYPFPDEALAPLATSTLSRLQARRSLIPNLTMGHYQ